MNLCLRVVQYILSVVLFCIRKPRKEFEHSYKITDEMFLTTSADIVETFGSEDAPEKYLVALGCASWTAGQLEQEIADNAWLVAPASDTILFETIYEDRYPACESIIGDQSS